jgi:hypothetical protein
MRFFVFIVLNLFYLNIPHLQFAQYINKYIWRCARVALRLGAAPFGVVALYF